MYLRDYIVTRKLDQPTGLGRIYRVIHESTRRDTSTPFANATPAQLVAALSHPNGWRRDTAQRLLVERRSVSAVSALTALAERTTDWRTRLHALWTLDGLDRIEPALVLKSLEDPSRDVRVAAIRIAERWLGEAGHPVQAGVLKRLDDTDWAVRQQLAASVGALPPGAREPAFVALFERHGADPVVMDALLSGLRGSEESALDRILAHSTTETPERAAAITMVTAMIVRAAQDQPVQNVLTAIADEARPAWQRSALVRGAEVALLGSQMPGTPARRGGGPAVALPAPPCPTCPGARAGPGGAYAFPGVREAQQAAAAPAAAAGRGGGPSLRLNREPAAFAAIATSASELAPRVTAVLARVEWPEKPGVRVPLAPLTPVEQQRFDRGREVYRNACQSCHQPDGRGQERVAASLIGSTLALAAPEIPTRILINGKEGDVGLMPPLGAMLDDEQIASVLTYIRREWGQTGWPVDPSIVATVRALTATRPRPWTTEELMNLAPGPGTR
jgi:mono/diheme cytochrome c family protein